MSLVSPAAMIAGRYRLDHQVATDGSGEVWRGTDVELARPVAVKLLHADGGDTDVVSRFRAAACRAASLSHEGLIRVFDYSEAESSDSAQCPFLVMEYVDGQSLAGQLGSGPLGAARTADIVAQVSAALRAVHRAGLAHGDVRPEKILVSRGGEAKLFGFSGTCPTGSAAIGADLRALGTLARECLGEGSLPDGDVAELVAGLCAHPATDRADDPASIARRAAALRARLGQNAAAGDRAAPLASVGAWLSLAPGSWSAASTQPLSRLPGRAGRRTPALPAGQAPAKHARVVAVRASAVGAIALAAVGIFGAVALKPGGGAPQADGAAKAALVRVATARLTGRPVDVVRLRLRRLGLVVRLRWRPSDSVSAGDVIAVRPAGLVPVHSVVVIVGSSGTGTAPDVGQARTPHRRRSGSRRHPSHQPPPAPTSSGSSSPAPAPSPSPSSSSTPAPSPTSPPPSGSPPPSTAPAPAPPA